MKKIFILSCLLIVANILSAQDITVTGTVTSAQDAVAVPGASIRVKGTAIGTITDMDGTYSLSNVPADATLVISYVGMVPQEITVGNQREISVILDTDILGLEEVLVIGYGSAQAKDLTAPIITVRSEEILRISSTSAVSALQGIAPGVQVRDRGAPGGTPEVIIRGTGSMHGSAPLYVVDGALHGDINWLNPNDIKEISILKDASAAAIYGVRAAGGVVLITTKSGNRDGSMTVEYNGYVGVETTNNILEMSNGKEYSTMMIEAGLSAQLADAITAFGAAPDKITWQGVDYDYPNNDVDYYDELMKNGIIQNHNLSLRGGSENIDYRVSASYYSAEGRLINDHKYQRMNIVNKINYNPTKWLELGTNLIIVNDKNSNSANTWAAMYNAVPILPLWEDNGDYGQRTEYGYITGSATSNPIVTLDQADGYGDHTKNTGFMMSAHVELDFLSNDKLKWRTQVTQDNGTESRRNYNPQYQSGNDWARLESTLNKRLRQANFLQIDNTLTYQDNFGSHGLTVMGGMFTRKWDRSDVEGDATGIPWGDDGREEFLYFYNGDAGSQIAGDDGVATRGVSYLGRVMYNYSHKYLLNATFRADGTDKYTETWGYFPSVGIGWVLSQEAFMSNLGFLDYAKIRASYGQLGNNNVPRDSGSQSIEFTSGNTSRPYDHSYLFNGALVSGYEASIDYNTLVWESVSEINIGVDLAFVNNKLSLEADWYRKITNDAAIETNGIMGSGVTPSLTRNVGEILNTGFEFLVNWRDRVGDFGYSISANFTTLHNEVLTLQDEYILGGNFERRQRTTVGQPLWSFYGKEVIGIYQNQQEIDDHLYGMDAGSRPNPGWFKYEDLDDNGIIDADDNKYLGANVPDIIYGGSINLDWKDLILELEFMDSQVIKSKMGNLI